MCLIYFVLFTTVLEANTQIWENIHNNDGWTPISRDKVYHSLDENLFSTMIKNTNEVTHSQRIFADLQSPENVVPSRYINFQDNITPSQFSPNFFTDSKRDKDEENVVQLNTSNNRKAKATSDNGANVANMLPTPEKNITQRDSDNSNEQATVQHKNQYQVTENQEQKQDLETIDSDIIKPLIKEPSNNQYDIVNGTVQDATEINSNEFTNKLLGILSNYNIRVNDVLSNYEMSRHSSRNPSAREYIMVPIPIRLANRFNSLNPSPFDPLLAVFLSNFGYYLPGHYGINNKYYNLYGYLASNNIHNNGPFGSYKIFADTDSWN